MLGHKKELAILLALGCGWTLGGMSTEGGTAPSVSLFNRCEANVQVKIGTTKADAVETTVVNNDVMGHGYVSITDSTGSTSYSIKRIFGNTTSATGNASNATVEIDAGENAIDGFVYGAFSHNTASAENNTLRVSSGRITRPIYGAHSDTSTASKNRVYISGGNIEHAVLGASSNYGVATENEVYVSGGTITDTSFFSSNTDSVVGGGSAYNNAYANRVTISGGEIKGKVIGGHSSSSGGNATANIVTLSGGTITGLAIYGGYSYDGNTTDNTINLYGTADISATSLYGGNQNFTGNTLNIGDTASKTPWTGGNQCVKNVANFENIHFNVVPWWEDTPTLKKPALTITDGTASNLSNTKVDAATVYFKTASAIANGAKMTLLDASVIADDSKKLKATNITAESTFTVGTTLQGTGTLSLDENGNVIYTVGQGTPAPTPGSDNTIVLRGDMDVSDMQLTVDPQGPMGILYVGDATTKTPWTGGKQNVKDLTYFQNIHFCVVPWWEQKPALTITDGSGSNLSYTKVDAANVYFTNVSTLAKNQRMTLLDASRITDATKKLQAANIQKASKFTVGTTGEGEGELSLDANGNVIYTVTRGSSSGGDSPTIQAQEQTHKTVMGMEASMATLAVGNDFIGRTLDGLADVENEGKDGLSVFAAYGGGTSKYETGSYIRANTWNAILGLGKNNRFGNKDDKERGFFQWGAFFEYGSGNYSTHDCDVRGDGSAQYTGGGLLAKWKNDNGVYAEGSVRAGSVTDKASNMLHDILGGSYGYDTRANYLGAHVGLGKIYRFGDDHELDLYGKYFYTQRDGVSFDAGGRYNLDKVTSNILRVGMRYGMTGKKWNWFGGLAYEYEFDGKATGTADGAEIRAADISGGSLRAEVGVVMKPSEESPWSMRMSAEGYCGERQGFGGTLSLTYAF